MNIQNLITPKKKYRYRSSKTGKFVTKEYALANPETTEKEAIK